MVHRRWQAGLIVPLLLLACDDNPTEISQQLTVDLAIVPGHIHLLQSEVTFTVEVRDSRGDPVTDFETLQVERLQSGSEVWRGIDLVLQGDVYEGTYVFTSSGDYEVRVTGLRPGETEAQVLYTAPEMLHVVRAHMEQGGYRIEFEAFPGHIHTDNTAALSFWVMEPDENIDGVRPPITGLTAEIHCLEAGGGEVFLTAVEVEPGVYEADNLFVSAGVSHVGLHFTATDNTEAEAAFDVEIVPAH